MAIGYMPILYYYYIVYLPIFFIFNENYIINPIVEAFMNRFISYINGCHFSTYVKKKLTTFLTRSVICHSLFYRVIFASDAEHDVFLTPAK